MLIRLVFVLLVLFCLGTATRASALATVCSVNFTPESGGPGTFVHVKGNQCYGDGSFYIQPGLSIEYGSGGTRFQSLGKPLTTINRSSSTDFSATFTLPARLPDGSRITNRDLTLRVINRHGDNIDEGGRSTFVITSSTLPGAGHFDYSGGLLALLTGAFLLVCGVLSRRFAGSLVRRK